MLWKKISSERRPNASKCYFDIFFNEKQHANRNEELTQKTELGAACGHQEPVNGLQMIQLVNGYKISHGLKTRNHSCLTPSDFYLWHLQMRASGNNQGWRTSVTSNSDHTKSILLPGSRVQICLFTKIDQSCSLLKQQIPSTETSK